VTLYWLIAGLAFQAAGAQAANTIVGAMPAMNAPPTRIAWIDSDPSAHVICALASPLRWECSETPDRPHALVVLIADDGVIAVPVGPAWDRGSSAIKRWGRLVVVTSGAVAAEELRGLKLTAWKPERSAYRTKATRFVPAEASSIDTVSLGDGAFWIAGDETDPDAFVRLDAVGIAAGRISVAELTDGPADARLFVAAGAPLEMVGVVESDRGASVDTADVELFEPLTSGLNAGDLRPEERPMIRVAQTRTNDAGAFAFERLCGGPFLVTAARGDTGRGATLVDDALSLVVVRLTPPSRVTGRVLRNREPVAGARVRFVPSAAALMASANPKELLAEEQTTGLDGRFSLPLPATPLGEIQIIGSDGASARVAASDPGRGREASVGDIVLPDHRHLTARLLDAPSCTLSAVGPLGGLGLTIVHATATANLHWFDLPEPGQWTLDAECGGRSRVIEPAIVYIPADGPDILIDVSIVR
jgi:hypothetical protein